MTSYGAYDMAGNVREWCWKETPEGRLIRGGAWNDNSYMFSNWSQAPAFNRSDKNGFRCVVYPDSAEIPEQALQSVKFGREIDFYKQTPVSDDVFQAYKNQFSYDQTNLNAEVEQRIESAEDWVQEKITFDAAYGNERVIAYLFLPKNTSPPFQAGVYFPGSGSVYQKSSEDIEKYLEFEYFFPFILKSGRAILYPVYKGTFERREDALGPIHGGANSHLYTEFLIQLVKDFKKCLDYLETRQDIDSSKFAFFGMSWGAQLGAIIPAVEERIKASILVLGGLEPGGFPEANSINYVTRVKTPTLMLNGRYETTFIYEIHVKPMFDLLGTADEHKKQKLYESDHHISMTELIREILAWFDRYLGPVK
jgi:dienelactone hydrolase